jgi:hypothetical protein
MADREQTRRDARVFPHSGVCANCRRERDDLFWHKLDMVYYCADVFRCEARLSIQAQKNANV